MGSPISVVIAEIVMQKLEEDIFNNYPCYIFCWKRYVDDCFAIIPTDYVERFLPYINIVSTETFSSPLRLKIMELYVT